MHWLGVAISPDPAIPVLVLDKGHPLIRFDHDGAVGTEWSYSSLVAARQPEPSCSLQQIWLSLSLLPCCHRFWSLLAVSPTWPARNESSARPEVRLSHIGWL